MVVCVCVCVFSWLLNTPRGPGRTRCSCRPAGPACYRSASAGGGGRTGTRTRGSNTPSSPSGTRWAAALQNNRGFRNCFWIRNYTFIRKEELGPHVHF